MLMGLMAVMRSVVLPTVVMQIVIRVRDEFLAAAFRAEVEIAPAVGGTMLGVLRNRHPADDVDHGVRTRLPMVMMRMRSAMVGM
jgi:hypothetical protein